ncbi:uncharacterized protein K444DRAFT_699098, partial [Hyaloscypha bicolor E]
IFDNTGENGVHCCPYLTVLTQTASSREKLKVATGLHIASQSTGHLDSIQAVLRSNATYAENLATVDITRNSTLSQPLKIDHIHSLMDATS